MGSDPSSQIPVINFSLVSPELDRGTKEWHLLCEKVREACESYGYFETKKKNVNPNPFYAYAGQYATASLYESLGIEDASDPDSVRRFEELMWPQGNDFFSKTISSITQQMDELNRTTRTLILDAYGLGETLNSIMPCTTLLRLTKYKASPNGEYMEGITAHTDKLLSALLCANQVFGLEVEAKDGQWIKLFPSPNSFIYMVGDPLMAWSNGRMHAANHRVMMEGYEDRYSLGAFPAPMEGTTIKPIKELVDEEHPQILEEFDYMEFIRFSLSKESLTMDSAGQAFAFAGNY
ncbi:unnamed protein product [Ilex paraguariensis]|uniref:Fe2OG dioxygenase domain-containing protein n=1 Tax=Ilex paraguariensis TaxID=185542 RepID=A0ABC8UWE6_9AQUA